MKFLRELEYSIKRIALPVFFMFLLGYIFYHTVSGERGISVWYTLSDQVRELKKENKALAAQIAILQRDVDRLSGNNPDIDYIDELVRRNLPVLQKNEQVAYIKLQK